VRIPVKHAEVVSVQFLVSGRSLLVLVNVNVKHRLLLCAR